MAVRVIAFPPGPAWVQDVALDGRIYTLAARYNTRARTWVMGIQSSDGIPLIDGLRLVLGERLLGPQRYDPRLPPGELLVVAVSGDSHGDPGRDDIGPERAMRLVYMEAASVAAL